MREDAFCTQLRELAYYRFCPILRQVYPTRPVRLLVGFPPGGGSDVGARIIANRLSEVWGQQVVVENKPGAGGHLAIEVAAHSNPDDYTIIWVGGAIPLYGLMIKSINYDPDADLAPVTLVGTYPNLLAVPNFSPWKSVQDLIAAARAKPGIVTFSSPGVGTSPHLTGVLFARMAGIDIRHVSYRGGVKTPAPIVQKVSHDAAEILSEPAVRSKYEQLGVLSGGSSPTELADRGRSEAKLWRSVPQAAGIQSE